MRRYLRLLFLPLAAAQAAPPAALLNHFYATVDPITYAAIERSAFLKEQFAPFEKRTTVRNDSTYSGLYFYGLQTYFEFFAEGEGERKKGDAGLALGLEQPGASEALREQWQRLRPAEVTTVTRELGSRPAPWFRMASFQETRANSAVPGFRLFSMEYAPGFLEAWGTGPRGSIRLADILAAYCEKLGQAEKRRTTLLANVARVEIAGPEAGLKLRSQQLQSAGWKVTQKSSGIIECKGPNSTVILLPSPEPQSVRRVVFTLQKPSQARTETIGHTTLRLNGRIAVWTF